MGLITSRYKDYVSRCIETENVELHEFYSKEYGFLMPMNLLYPQLNTFRGKLLNVFYFTTFTSVMLYQLVVTAISVVKALNWRLDVALQILILFMAILFCLAIYLSLVIYRTNGIMGHEIIRKKFYVYTLEITTKNQQVLKKYHTLIRPFVKVFGLLLTCSAMALTVMRPPGEERYVEGLDRSLPIVVWSPFPLDSWPPYLAACLLQILAAGGVLVVLPSGAFAFFNTTFYILRELQRLNDSIVETEQRAMFLFYKEVGKVTLRKMKIQNPPYGNKTFNACLNYCMKENADHHLNILRCYNFMRKVIDLPIFVVFVAFAVAIACCLSSLTMEGYLGGRISALSSGVAALSAVAVICYLGQLITDKSENLHAAFYQTKWYLVKDRHIILNLKILFEVLRKPIKPNAFGIVTYNLNVFAIMLQSAYSYYNLLRLVQESH